MQMISDVELLFLNPPNDFSVIEKWIKKTGRENVIIQLIDYMQNGTLDYMFWDLFSELIYYLDFETNPLHDSYFNAIFSIIEDEDMDLVNRRMAFIFFVNSFKSKAVEATHQLGLDEFVRITDGVFVAMLHNIYNNNLDDPDIITNTLIDYKKSDIRERAIQALGRARQEIGLEAYKIYDGVLCSPQLVDCHMSIIKEIEDEGLPAAIPLLERAIEISKDKKIQQSARKVLFKLRTSAISDTGFKAAPKGKIYLGSCDGTGDYMLAGYISFSDKKWQGIFLVMNSAEGIKDGFEISEISRNEFDEIIENFISVARTNICELSFNDIPGILNDVVEKTDMSNLSRTTIAAIDIFQKINAGQHEPDIIKTKSISDPMPDAYTLETELQKALTEEIFTLWRLSPGDLKSIGIKPLNFRNRPIKSSDMPQDCNLELSPVLKRIYAMFDYTSTWYSFAGQPGKARLFAWATADMDINAGKSAALKLMVEKSIKYLNESQLYEDHKQVNFGNISFRRKIRMKKMANVTNPTARHMAWLDLTEISFHRMDDVLSEMMSKEERPDDKILMNIAFETAKTFTLIWIDQSDSKIPDRTERLVKKIANTGDFSYKTAKYLVDETTPYINLFVERICSKCKAECLKHPGRNMKKYFFSIDEHPAAKY
jgi:hypothetical protein